MEGNIPNGIPPFDGSNFEYWKNRMETYLKALGEDVWISVASGYNALKKPKTAAQKEAKRNNKLAIDTILDGLTDSVKSKVGSCASAKDLWDKLQELYAREEAKEEEEVEEDYNISDFKEENRGQFFCFNCEGVGHVEFECPHPRIERNDTEEENSNEEEENHKEKIIQQEDENLKKLKHVEIENSKLKDTQRKLRSELVSCEKTVVSLKKQLEDFQKLREETISLKTLLEEARRIAEVKKVQMIKKEEDCEKLEQEVVSLRKSLRNSQVPKELTHLGCMGETSYKKDSNTNKKVEERATQTVDEKWTRIPERRNDYKRDEFPRRPPTFRNQRSFNQYEGNYRRVDHEPRWTTSQRRSLTPRYQNFFLGHCYTCKNFGHKAINCRINERNKYTRNMNGVNRRYGNNRGFVNISYNSFYPLMDKNIVCYKCNYLGHKARDCRYMNEDVPMPTTVWRRKEIPNNEDCRIALTAEECKEEDEWYIDSGCSSHMTGDQDKFISLKRKDGNVAFGDDSSAKILGEGVVELGRKNVKAKNVLLVEDLNHNLLSVSKMCDQGYTLTFDSRKCKIRENNSGRLVATATRRPNNIYILDMKKREKTKATQKDSKEEKVPKTKNKDEVLLSATCLGGAAPKKKVTFFH
jgi:hypothetical protein